MPTPAILFFDLEVHPRSNTILEFGAILDHNQYRGKESEKFIAFCGPAEIICGHNIIRHDLAVLNQHKFPVTFFQKPIIDTLYLSALLFPKKPYHRLVKDYQLDGSEINNPLADAKLANDLCWESLAAFQQLPKELQTIYWSLLEKTEGFSGFFKCMTEGNVDLIYTSENLAKYVEQYFSGRYCGEVNLEEWINKYPVELAFALAIIGVEDMDSILPKWVAKEFPKTFSLMNSLRVDCPGNRGCRYCDHLSPRKGLKRFFDYDNFRSFTDEEGKPLQEQVVEAALANKSLLAVFPTGGGKSLAFQLPALMKGAANRSLTVIISPLQSLMKDQVDVLRKRHDVTSAVTINGMLSPLERMEAIDRVENGGANLLYISPESLRSNTIMRLFMRRTIDRFVIDEAHCFSSWGQDFRVDYLYIGKFIKKLIEVKRLVCGIPVSCFTATAKPAVIDDICKYFKEYLDLDMEVFTTQAKRENLKYEILKVNGKEEKYEKLRGLLRDEEGATIVYVSRVKRAEQLVEQLYRDGITGKAYHGQMERDDKIRIQDEFISNEKELNIIVATSAFGMGVDKDNVKMVVHYNISDSLENYMQESGRAGRKENLLARCIVLFDKNDLDAHFQLLNITKLSLKEVYLIWQGVKKFKTKTFTKSALEIARLAGWDTEMRDLETKVRVAIAALEESGYVTREENAPRIFAQSILVKSVDEAIEQMNVGIHQFNGDRQFNHAKRVISSLMSRAKAKEDTRVDYLAETLELERHEVTTILNIFKSMDILGKEKDLSAFYFTVQGKRNSKNRFAKVAAIEKMLFELIFPHNRVNKKDIYLREINEIINQKELASDVPLIREILNYWSRTNSIRKERIHRPNDQYLILLNTSFASFKENMENRLRVAEVCLKVLGEIAEQFGITKENIKDKKLIEFSVVDLKIGTESITQEELPIRFYEYVLLYFHHLDIIELKDGLMIYYNPMKITREIDNFRKQYTKEDYEQLAQHYERKTEQIHIVGEYASKQLENNILATQFVDDYFTLPYIDFLQRYFRGKVNKIRKPITQEKFNRIFTELSPEQLRVINDNEHDNILVAAGPGSGKTRVLVHKVASLLLMEDIKPDQFLMLTFSRPAALEFKNRLRDLVGVLAYQIDIFTYHGFAFQLAGRMGDLERSTEILQQVTRKIEEEEIPLDRIQSKAVIVVDEYQDVSEAEYEFLMALANRAEKVRMIAVGDDDQNIYEFRGSSIQYMRNFEKRPKAKTYYLIKNYRAKNNLVEFSNLYLKNNLSSERIKSSSPLIAYDQRNGHIQIVNYASRNLILPLVEQIKNQALTGSTAVLTHTNNEAVLITGLLKTAGFPAQLISDKQGFFLRNLLEIKAFTYLIFRHKQNEVGLIAEEQWAKAHQQIEFNFQRSKNLDLVNKVINSFADINPKKFKSEWRSYLQQIRIEDFYHPEKGKLLVTTMHKAKGKEFDNVFILLQHFKLEKEDQKRVLYVAMTRAKENLFIHTSANKFNTNKIANLNQELNSKVYPNPNKIILELSLKDVNLSFFKDEEIVYHVKQLSSGKQLFPSRFDEFEFCREGGERVMSLSQQGKERIQKYLDEGYAVKWIVAKYIVVWYDEVKGKEYRVVLGELGLISRNISFDGLYRDSIDTVGHALNDYFELFRQRAT